MSLKAYADLRQQTPIRDVSFGALSIHLYPAEELEEAQVGYRVGESGEDFTGRGPGDWKEDWYVIAYEDLCGDPIFIDVTAEGFPVFTAVHGVGDWQEDQIADSFVGLISALSEVQAASLGRNSPIALERNPLHDMDFESVMGRIRVVNPGSPLDFWENWLRQ